MSVFVTGQYIIIRYNRGIQNRGSKCHVRSARDLAGSLRGARAAIAGEAAVHDSTCTCEGEARCCRMLRAAALTRAGGLQQGVGTQWERVLLVLCFLRPRQGVFCLGFSS